MLHEISTVEELRRRLEGAFRPDTASQGFPGTTPSTGHCAVVAAIVHEVLGGELISTMVQGHSHWINRIQLNGQTIDADLTGDQFGRPPIQIGRPGELYPGLRLRAPVELTFETLDRARLLAERAGLVDVARAFGRRLGTLPNALSRRAQS